MKITVDQIAQMSKKEKLLIMEAIWADLSRTDTEVESPEWHEDALRETEQRYVAGQKRLVEWDEAKEELRKEFD